MNRINISVLGWSQITKRKDCIKDNITPIDIMIEASISALKKVSSNAIFMNIDGIMVVKVLSSFYPSAAKCLAERLGIRPKFIYDSGIGGHSPQYLVNKAAGMIARGELETILIAGAEAFYPKSKDKNFLLQGIPHNYHHNDMVGSTMLESFYGVSMPLDGFSFFETALWGSSNLSLKQYLKKIGKFGALFSKIASKQKNAWICEKRSSEQITSVSKNNSMIVFPYTKFMCPIINVNMGAAIILGNEKKYSKNGFNNSSNKVYFVGGGYAQDRQRFLIEKSDYSSSIPFKNAVDKALFRSSLSLKDIQCFDFYSCFPSTVFIAKKMLNLDDKDNRPLTVTGGLSSFGGPGNNYSLHSIVTLAEMINRGVVQNGMITALGWFMHKHSVGIYSSEPTYQEIKNHDIEDQINFLAGNVPLKPIDIYSGKGILETYTIHYYKRNDNKIAIIYGKSLLGQRFIGCIIDKDMLNEITVKNYIGKQISVTNVDGKNIVELC